MGNIFGKINFSKKKYFFFSIFFLIFFFLPKNFPIKNKQMLAKKNRFFGIFQQQFWDSQYWPPLRGGGVPKQFFLGNILIFDDGSFHTEPSPHRFRLYPHGFCNIKGNNFLGLFDAWVSSVQCRGPERFPAFSLVELLDYCPLIGRGPQSVKILHTM